MVMNVPKCLHEFCVVVGKCALLVGVYTGTNFFESNLTTCIFKSFKICIDFGSVITPPQTYPKKKSEMCTKICKDV